MPRQTSTFSTLAKLYAAGAFCVAAALSSAAASETSRPLKIVVFDVELDDFSAGGPIAGESAEETARLRKMTLLARDLLSQAGLFEIVDGSASKSETAREHWLRKCNGCEAEAARDLGADVSFLCFFRKINVMEQYLEFRLRDARTGALLNVSQTDLRGETDESWSRALKFLIRRRLVEPELAKRHPPLSP
jgi:hypothetical protein